MTETDRPSTLLDAVLNLSRFHREHEILRIITSRARCHTAAPGSHAPRPCRPLGERHPSTAPPLSPYAGADDLNDPAALQLEGVLFMEGEGEPAELTHLLRDLRTTADDYLGPR